LWSCRRLPVKNHHLFQRCRLLNDLVRREQSLDSSEVQLSPQKYNESYCIDALAKSVLDEYHRSLCFPENCNLDLSGSGLLKF